MGVARGVDFKSLVNHPIINEIFVNCCQHFMAPTYSDFFQGGMDRDLFYFPNHQGELCSPKKIFRIRE
jgi:hypothetical protein